MAKPRHAFQNGNGVPGFDDKQWFRKISRDFEKATMVGNADLTPGEKLQAMIEFQVDFFIDRFYETCVFLIETKALGQKYQRYYIAKRDKYEGIWRKVIEDGMKIGEFRKGDAKLITVAIFGMLNWLVIWFKPGKGWTSEKITGAFTKFVFEGILKR